MIITIDGPAAAGKGTLASKLSKKYNLAYFDTGMVYRAVGLELMLAGISPEDVEKATDFAQKLTFQRMNEISHHSDTPPLYHHIRKCEKRYYRCNRILRRIRSLQTEAKLTAPSMTGATPVPLFVRMLMSNSFSPHHRK